MTKQQIEEMVVPSETFKALNPYFFRDVEKAIQRWIDSKEGGYFTFLTDTRVDNWKKDIANKAANEAVNEYIKKVVPAIKANSFMWGFASCSGLVAGLMFSTDNKKQKGEAYEEV